MNDLERKLSKARLKLAMQAPFLGWWSFRCELSVAERIGGRRLDTAATDGKRIAFGPDFLERLSMLEAVAVLAHEAMHVALGHHLRRGTRDAVGWNIATDHVINIALERDGFHLPADRLLDQQYSGMGAERVYSLLPKPPEPDEQPEGGDGDGEEGDGDGEPIGGTFGEVLDACDEEGKPLNSEALAEADLEQQVAVGEATAYALAAGDTSAAAAVALEARVGEVDWRRELREAVEVSAANREDYSWRRPSRRFAGADVVLPSLRGRSLGEIVVAVDTSGSVVGVPNLLSDLTAEIEGLLADYPETVLHVLFCDTAVQRVARDLTLSDCPLNLTAAGGGGTLFAPVFAWVEQYMDTPPSVLVYLTDLLPSDDPPAPGYPVVFAAPLIPGWQGVQDKASTWGRRVWVPTWAKRYQ